VVSEPPKDKVDALPVSMSALYFRRIKVGGPHMTRIFTHTTKTVTNIDIVST
jgi:hypothetical protein